MHHGGTAQIYAEDKLRELVALANGLDEHKRIDAATVEQALAALSRFGERLAASSPPNVRAVATNTFRVAPNAAEILPAAERAGLSHRNHLRQGRSPPDLPGRDP